MRVLDVIIFNRKRIIISDPDDFMKELRREKLFFVILIIDFSFQVFNNE